MTAGCACCCSTPDVLIRPSRRALLLLHPTATTSLGINLAARLADQISSGRVSLLDPWTLPLCPEPLRLSSSSTPSQLASSISRPQPARSIALPSRPNLLNAVFTHTRFQPDSVRLDEPDCRRSSCFVNRLRLVRLLRLIVVRRGRVRGRARPARMGPARQSDEDARRPRRALLCSLLWPEGRFQRSVSASAHLSVVDLGAR